jgi:23S rRNA (adenine2030-N6)-methyltransferase
MPAPGVYDLTGEEARRGGEWLTGIARLMQARFSEKTAAADQTLSRHRQGLQPQRRLEAYPGSPLIARALLRPQDRLTACEVEPKARKRLIEALRRDTQAGWSTSTAGRRCRPSCRRTSGAAWC